MRKQRRRSDQRLCFRYSDGTFTRLSKSIISSLYSYFVAAKPGLCRTWSESPKTGFLTSKLIWNHTLHQMCCAFWLSREGGTVNQRFRARELHGGATQDGSSGHFFRIFQLIIFCFAADICDLMHDVEDIHSLC